jgi:hypothetical protein
VINAAARLVVDLSPRDHVTPALLLLHWLPIEYRVRYKLCLLVHQAIKGRAPPYLANLLMTVASVSSRASLRSAGHGDLLIPSTRQTGQSGVLSLCPHSFEGSPNRPQVLYQFSCF